MKTEETIAFIPFTRETSTEREWLSSRRDRYGEKNRAKVLANEVGIVLCLLSFVLCPFQVFGQYQVSHHQEFIRVFPEDDRFTSEIRVLGNMLSEEASVIDIPYHETEEPEKLVLEYRTEQGKTKKIRGKRIISEPKKNQYFDLPLSRFTLELPPTAKEFEYTYKKVTRPLLLLTSLPLLADKPTDTITYVLALPNTHRLHYELDGNSSLLQDLEINIDSTSFEGETRYTIQAVPSLTLPASTNPAKNLRSDFQAPILQVNVAPKTVGAYSAFCSAYLDLLAPFQVLDTSTLRFFEELLAEEDNDFDKVNRIYTTVRDRVSYYAPRNNIHAVLPHQAEWVWTKKQGDCKDMSNLIHCLLRHFGFKARLVLATTQSYAYRKQFAGLGAFNHLMNEVVVEEDTLYLDATEKGGMLGFPSRKTQGSEVLVFDRNGHEFKTIPIVSKDANVFDVHYNLGLNEEENGFEGIVNLRQEGLASVKSQAFAKSTDADISAYLQALLFLEQRPALLSFEAKAAPVLAMAQLNFSNLISKNKAKRYLPLDFLPFPHDLARSIPAGFTLTAPHTQDNRFFIQLDFKRPIRTELPEGIDFYENGLGFYFKIEQKNEDSLYISYRFTNEHLEIGEGLLETYAKINVLAREMLDLVLVFK